MSCTRRNIEKGGSIKKSIRINARHSFAANPTLRGTMTRIPIYPYNMDKAVKRNRIKFILTFL
jgi:hypothetical protein